MVCSSKYSTRDTTGEALHGTSRSRLRRRIWFYLLTPLLLVALSAGCLIWGHLAFVYVYDTAYKRLERGDHVERAVQLLGTPHATRPMPRSPLNEHDVTLYIYRVYPFLLGENPFVRYEWCIGVDESNRIVGMFRSDNGC